MRHFAVISGLLLASLSLIAHTADEFTIVVLPDTQNYSEFRPEIFRKQTEWIAANRDSLNIKVVLGVGDIVNHGSSEAEYLNADAAVDVLDGAGVPYLLALGNHDYDNSTPSTRSAVLFNQYFGPARYASAAHYSGSYPEGSNENFYGTMEINGQQYLLLALEFNPRQTALDWASGILTAHTDKQAIIFTHSYTNDDDSRVGRCDMNNAEAHGVGTDNDGDEMWDKLISRHANIGLVLSGHISTVDGAGRLAQLGVNGNLVNQILSDYQARPEGGGGFLRIMRFRPSANQIDVTTYSPHLDASLTDPDNQFTVAIRNLGQNDSLPGTVAGRIRSTSCNLLAGATVSHADGSVTADAGGKYELGAPAGTQSIAAAASGFETETTTALVTPGWPVYKDFFLRAETACSPDTSAPSAKICSPFEGSTINSPVRVLAAGYSPNSIRHMELWVDGIKKYQVLSDQVDTSLEITAGAHRITAVAVEPSGLYYKGRVNVTVADSGPTNSPPTAVLSVSPTSGTAPVTVTASTAASSDSDGIASSNIDFGDGSIVSGPEAIHTYGSAGTYGVKATVTDSKGASATSATQNVTVTSAAPPGPCTLSTVDPSITICSPANQATVSSPVRIVAGTTSSSAVTTMKIYLDNVQVYSVNADRVDTSVPMTPGTRRIVVQAWNRAGAVFKQSITLNVTSGEPPSPTTCSAAPNAVNICTPADQAKVGSPVNIVAAANSSAGISFTQVYVDGIKKYQVNGGNVDTSLAMSIGIRRVTVQARDTAGLYLKKTIFITVQ